MDILKRANEIKDEVIANRRHFHQNPEIGHQLDGTVAYVKEKLTAMGYSPMDCGDHGVIATVGKPGKCILLRGDMDALPMAEDSGLPFASTCNYAHTCGHDIHTAMLLGAAKILKEMEDQLPGTVKLMFQPAEECITGAASMIKDGLMENPKVDAAVAIHIMALEPTGKIVYNTGAVAASSDMFEIVVTGVGGHGAMPHHTVDPVNVGAHIVIALQELLAREIAPSDTAVLTIGCFKAGETGNIIPQNATIMGTIRTYDASVREFLNKRLEEVAKGVAATFRASADLRILSSTPPLVSEEKITRTLGAAIGEMLGEGMTRDDFAALSGSEDFAYVGELVPTAFYVLGGDPGDREVVYGQHHPKVYFDENALPNGVASYVQAAVTWLADNQ